MPDWEERAEYHIRHQSTGTIQSDSPFIDAAHTSTSYSST